MHQITIMSNFELLGLNPVLQEAVAALGFTTPTEIQQKAIPRLLEGTTDFIGLAQTGTGKTAAFGLPLLQLIDAGTKKPQALVVCPTRELCMQIVKEIESFTPPKLGIKIVAVYGGAAISQQIKAIQKGVQIVVATPGRLIDLLERRALNMSEIEYVVLDEADEMLNMGFKEDIDRILEFTPNRNSMWLFSATMPPPIRQVVKKFMTSPVEMSAGKINTANVNIEHQYFVTTGPYRYETLKRLIDFNPALYALIFTRTKLEAQEIAEKLTREGYNVDSLHGDLSQPQRDKVMNSFRNRSLQMIVATDVAARGIDVSGITHVINYELPDDPEIYTHRSGRTGRAGLTGICLSIVTSREMRKIRMIEDFIKQKLTRIEIPEGRDVTRKQFYHSMDKLIETDISHGEYETHLPYLQERFSDMSKEEVLQRVASFQFDRFLKYYENAPNLNAHHMESGRNAKDKDRGKGKSKEREKDREIGDKKRKHSTTDANYKNLFINIGTKDGFYKASFLQYILDLSDVSKEVIGKIDLKNLNSYVEVEKSYARQMLKAIDGKTYKGRKIRMNEA